MARPDIQSQQELLPIRRSSIRFVKPDNHKRRMRSVKKERQASASKKHPVRSRWNQHPHRSLLDSRLQPLIKTSHRASASNNKSWIFIHCSSPSPNNIVRFPYLQMQVIETQEYVLVWYLLDATQPQGTTPAKSRSLTLNSRIELRREKRQASKRFAQDIPDPPTTRNAPWTLKRAN